MNPWIIGSAVLVPVLLTFFATLNLAVRVPSRARMAERFRRAGKAGEYKAFLGLRTQLMLATAVLRATTTLALFLIALNLIDAWDATLPEMARAAAFGMTLVTVLIFGVAIPNAWAQYAGEGLVLRFLPLLYTVRIVCLPLIIVLQGFDPLVRVVCGVRERAYADELEEEVLSAVSEMEREGAVDEEQKEMIESVMELSDTLVEQIMTPRTEIVALPRNADLQTVTGVVRAKGYSRIPVYDDVIDKILGVLYAKDLLCLRDGETFELTTTMRNALFVPESKPVRTLLHEFREQKVHMAIVLDEYGGTAGLITIEDILEELVGEIEDEHEVASPLPLKQIDEHTVEVDARMRIDDLNEQLGLRLPENEEYETVGGFVFSSFGRIPKVGDEYEHDNIGVQVIGAEPRRVTRVRLHISRPADPSTNSG